MVFLDRLAEFGYREHGFGLRMSRRLVVLYVESTGALLLAVFALQPAWPRIDFALKNCRVLNLDRVVSTGTVVGIRWSRRFKRCR